KQPPWTLRWPLRCFFSTRKTHCTFPVSSMRCQNGPLWVSKASRVQVRQPANSPSVSMCTSGWKGNAFWESSFTEIAPSIRDLAPLNPILRHSANLVPAARSRKALDSGKLPPKRPFRAPPDYLLTAHADQRTQDHP